MENFIFCGVYLLVGKVLNLPQTNVPFLYTFQTLEKQGVLDF